MAMSSQTAEVVIIGAGIAGASIAWHLTEAGCQDVVLLERETALGRGSTGKSMGSVRAQFATEVNIQMSLYSIPFFASFRERVGADSGYQPQGYLFCATTEAHEETLRANQARQQALGLKEVFWLDAAAIARLVPPLRTDDIRGGAFCPIDGFVDPYSVMNGFLDSAVARGVRLERGAEVTGLRPGVVVAGATTYSARAIVIAAGAWSPRVAALAGLDLPVQPLRRMLVPTESRGEIPETCPMTIDMATGFHFRPEGRGLLLAWNDPEETPGYKTAFDPAFLEKILTRAAERVPSMATVEVNPKRAWAGLYEMSPDHHAILGPAPECPNIYYATGFSGHGVMHSPATGKILADLLLEGSTSLIDASVLSAARFQQGRAIQETAVL